MTTDRITVSLDDDTSAALETLTNRPGNGQSELVRRALTFYAATFEAATTDASANLEEYHASEDETRFANLGELLDWLSSS